MSEAESFDQQNFNADLDENQYNLITQTGYHYNREMTKGDFPIALEGHLNSYNWSKTTVNSMKTFVSYLKSMAVLLSSYDDEFEMRQAILDVEIAFHKATLLCNHADTNTAEFITFKDLCFRYLKDRASRSRGSNRERILQGMIRQIVEQNVTQAINEGKKTEQRKRGLMGFLQRNNGNGDQEE